MLTKAKLRLPEHALTEISYHEEFEASRVVTLDSDGNWRLQDASEAADEKSGSSALHRRRAGKHRQEDDPAKTASKNGRSGNGTLLWFSSLPPSDLRQAQKQFSNGTKLLGTAFVGHRVSYRLLHCSALATGLQALLLAASSARKVQRAVHGVTTAVR
jgi:hypothetical protein